MIPFIHGHSCAYARRHADWITYGALGATNGVGLCMRPFARIRVWRQRDKQMKRTATMEGKRPSSLQDDLPRTSQQLLRKISLINLQTLLERSQGTLLKCNVPPSALAWAGTPCSQCVSTIAARRRGDDLEETERTDGACSADRARSSGD